MKAIIFITLLAIATADYIDFKNEPSSRLNFTAQYRGFAQGLGFNASVRADFQACFDAINGEIVKVLSAVEHFKKNDPEAILDIASMIQNAKQVVFPACNKSFDDIANMTIKANPDIAKQPLYETFRKTLADGNLAFFIQEVVRLIDLLSAGKQMNAGYVEATLMKLLTGLEKHRYDLTKFQKLTPSNETLNTPKNLKLYYGAMLEAMKIKDTNLTQKVINCVMAKYEWEQNLLKLKQFRSSQALEKINTIAKSIAATTEFVKDCADAYELGRPYRELARSRPVFVIATYLHNLGKNLPQIVQELIYEQAELMQGNFAAAGKIQGNLYNTVNQGFNITQ